MEILFNCNRFFRNYCKLIYAIQKQLISFSRISPGLLLALRVDNLSSRKSKVEQNSLNVYGFLLGCTFAHLDFYLNLELATGRGVAWCKIYITFANWLDLARFLPKVVFLIFGNFMDLHLEHTLGWYVDPAQGKNYRAYFYFKLLSK